MSKQAANLQTARAPKVDAVAKAYKAAPTPAAKTAVVAAASAASEARVNAELATQRRAKVATPRQRKIAMNVAKDRKGEAKAAASNAAVLAAAKANAAPPPAKVLEVGSGAAVGVAKGATDGQPHTAQAVREAAARAKAQGKPMGNPDPLRGKTRLTVQQALTHAGVRYAKLSPVNSKRRHLGWETISVDANGYFLGPVAASAIAKVAAPKAKAEPKAATPKADRAYKPGPTAFSGKAGTWTEYMVQTALAHKTTQAATAAHKASGRDDAGKPLDFKWMDAKGYIALA